MASAYLPQLRRTDFYDAERNLHLKETLQQLSQQLTQLRQVNYFLEAENSELRRRLVQQQLEPYPNAADLHRVGIHYGSRLAEDFGELVGQNRFLKKRLQQCMRAEARARNAADAEAAAREAAQQQAFVQELAADNRVALLQQQHQQQYRHQQQQLLIGRPGFSSGGSSSSGFFGGEEGKDEEEEERGRLQLQQQQLLPALADDDCRPVLTAAAKGLALQRRGGAMVEAGAAAAAYEEKEERECGGSGRQGGSRGTAEHCLCTEKLQQLLDFLEENLHSYERAAWQQQVTVLEEDRDELSCRVAMLQQQLAELQYRIDANPFAAAAPRRSLYCSTSAAAAGGPYNGVSSPWLRDGDYAADASCLNAAAAAASDEDFREEEIELRSRLAVAEHFNMDLERRLAFERNIARSWQANLRAMQRELRDYLVELAKASRSSGMHCDLFKGEILASAKKAAAAATTYGGGGGYSAAQRESLRLLRQARDRIAADARRMEIYGARIAELEEEAYQLRRPGITGPRALLGSSAAAAGAAAEPSGLSRDYSSGAAAAAANDVEPVLLLAKQLLLDRRMGREALQQIRGRRRGLRQRLTATDAVTELPSSSSSSSTERGGGAGDAKQRAAAAGGRSHINAAAAGDAEAAGTGFAAAAAAKMKATITSLSPAARARDLLLLQGRGVSSSKKTTPAEEEEGVEVQQQKKKKKKKASEVELLLMQQEEKKKKEEEERRDAEQRQQWLLLKQQQQQLNQQQQLTQQQQELLQQQLDAEAERIKADCAAQVQAVQQELERLRKQLQRQDAAEQQQQRLAQQQHRQVVEMQQQLARQLAQQELQLRKEQQQHVTVQQQEEEEDGQQWVLQQQQEKEEEEEEQQQWQQQQYREDQWQEERQWTMWTGPSPPAAAGAAAAATSTAQEEPGGLVVEEVEDDSPRAAQQTQAAAAASSFSSSEEALALPAAASSAAAAATTAPDDLALVPAAPAAAFSSSPSPSPRSSSNSPDAAALLPAAAETEGGIEGGGGQHAGTKGLLRMRHAANEVLAVCRFERLARSQRPQTMGRVRSFGSMGSGWKQQQQPPLTPDPQQLQALVEEVAAREKPAPLLPVRLSTRKRSISFSALMNEGGTATGASTAAEEEETTEGSDGTAADTETEGGGRSRRHLLGRKEETEEKKTKQEREEDEEEDEEEEDEEEEEDLPELSPRTQLLHKIYDRVSNLANAFREMDTGNKGTVTLHEFADFMEECGFEYPLPVVHSIYSALSRPANVLTLSLLYRNAEGNCSLLELGRRLEDIYGNLAEPFLQLEIPEEGEVTKQQFVAVAGKAGVTAAHAEMLWDGVDVLQEGHLLLQNVLLLLDDNVTLTEVKRVEEEHRRRRSSFFAIFAGAAGSPNPVPRSSRSRTMTKPTSLQRKLQRGFTESEAAVDDILEVNQPWDVLQPRVRQQLIRKLQLLRFAPGDSLQKADDSACPLYILFAGAVDLLQPGLLMDSLEARKEAPTILFCEELLAHKANSLTAVCREDTVVYRLDRKVFESHFEVLLVQRMRKVAEVQQLLKTVPILSRLEGFAARRLACCFEEKDYKEGEVIVCEEEEPEAFYVMKEGEAALVKERARSHKKAEKTATAAKGSSSSFKKANKKEEEEEEEEKEEEKVHVYRRGDYFGELAIFQNRPRTASIRAMTACTVLVLPRVDFEQQLRKFEADFRRRAGRVYSAQRHVNSSRSSGKPHRRKSAAGNSSSATHRQSEESSSSSSADAAEPQKQGPSRPAMRSSASAAASSSSSSSSAAAGFSSSSSGLTPTAAAIPAEQLASFSRSASRPEPADAAMQHLLAEEEEKEREDCLQLLERAPVLQELPAAKREELAAAMELECHGMYTPLIIEGEDSFKFFVLKCGLVSAQLYVGPGKPYKVLRTFDAGSFFGAAAAIKNERCACNIIAKTSVQVYSLPKDRFVELLHPYFDLFLQKSPMQELLSVVRTAAAAAGSEGEGGDSLAASERQQQQSRRMIHLPLSDILDLLQHLPVISLLSQQQLQALAQAFTAEQYQAHEIVSEEGSAADRFFVIYEGEVYVEKGEEEEAKGEEGSSSSHGSSSPSFLSMIVLRAGDYLGETALLTAKPLTATCVAKTDAKVLVLSKEDFQKYLSPLSEAFLQQANAKYEERNAQQQIPEWILEAKEQGAFYDPTKKGSLTSSSSKKSEKASEGGAAAAADGERRGGGEEEDEEEEPARQSSGGGGLRGAVDTEKMKYEKKKERRLSSSQKRKPSHTGSAAASSSSSVSAAAVGRVAAGATAAAADGQQQPAEEEKKKKKKKKDGEAGGDGGAAAVGTKTEKASSSSSAEGEEEKKKKKKKKEGGGAAEEAAAETQGEAAGKKKKKKKEEDKEKDDEEAAASPEESLAKVKQIKELVRGTLKNKYGSIAQAFHHIDANTSDMVDFEEFLYFVKSLHVRSLRKKDVELLFDDLCKPLVGRLTVANLYRNIDEGETVSRAGLNLRWVEIFGSPVKAFKSAADLSPQDRCTKQNFLKVAAAAGVTEENAVDIWKEMDRAEKGSMYTKIICDYMGGELTAEEAEKREAEEDSVGNRLRLFLGWGGSGGESTSTAAAAKQGEGGGMLWGGGKGETDAAAAAAQQQQLIDEALKYEDMAIVQRDDHRAFPACAKRLAAGLTKEEDFCFLQQTQARYVASLMKREVLPLDSRVLLQGEEPVLLWCARGKFTVMQMGFFGESQTGEVIPGQFFGVHELVHDEPLHASLVTAANNSAVWVLEKDIYHDLVEVMISSRKAVVPIFVEFLSTVPIVKDMQPHELQEVAAACKIEKFTAGQTVFRAGMPGDMFCFVFHGAVRMLKPQTQLPASLSSSFSGSSSSSPSSSASSAAAAAAGGLGGRSEQQQHGEEERENEEEDEEDEEVDEQRRQQRQLRKRQQQQQQQEPIELARLEKGTYFGEMGVIKNQRRTASVVAATNLTLLCLDKESFENVLAPVKGKMLERALSLYKRQDVTPGQEDLQPAAGRGAAAKGGAAAAGAGAAAGDVAAGDPAGARDGTLFSSKRTRKSSLALVSYTKIRDTTAAGGAAAAAAGVNEAGEGVGEEGEEATSMSVEDDNEGPRNARWLMAEDPKKIHIPPPLSSTPAKSILRRSTSPASSGSYVSARRNAVFFDESSLLPSPPSSDEEEGFS